MEGNKSFYPIYINLLNKSCLIVGGGIVAQRKVENLLEYGASITLVSPQITPVIKQYEQSGVIKVVERNFEAQDLDYVFMVFIATNDSEVNRYIAELCVSRQILVNAVDDPPNCDFFVPAVVKRGSLAIAISTTGKSPLLARQIKEDLENIYSEEYSEYVDLLGEYREMIKNSIPDINKRRLALAALIDLEILEGLKAGEREKVRERMEECISSWQD